MRSKMLRAWRWWKSHFFASLVSISPPRGVRRSNPAEHRTRSRMLVAPAHGLQSDRSRSRPAAFLGIPPHFSHPVRPLTQAAESLQKFATKARRRRPGRALWRMCRTTDGRKPGGKTPACSSVRSIGEAPQPCALRAAASRQSVGAGGAQDGRSSACRGELDAPHTVDAGSTRGRPRKRSWWAVAAVRARPRKWRRMCYGARWSVGAVGGTSGCSTRFRRALDAP